MIACPRFKVDPSPNYDPLKPFQGRPPGQGFVSWGNCLKCEYNKGNNRKKLEVKCGSNPEKIITLKSISL